MKIVEIQVEQTIKYEDTIEVVQPEGMSDERLKEILDLAEKKNNETEGGAKDLAHILYTLGVEIKSQTFSFPESPIDSEFEIFYVKS